MPAAIQDLQCQGWRFLSLAAWWDADDLARLAQATGLYAISPTYGQSAPQHWWKSYAQSYLKHGDAVAAVADIGEPVEEEDWAFEPAPTLSEHLVQPRKQLLASNRWGIGRPWSVEVSSDDLLWRVHVLFLLRLAGNARARIRSHLGEVILSGRPSELIWKGEGMHFKVPAKGTWPSPISINTRRLIESLRPLSAPQVHLIYGSQHLWVNGVPIPAREL